MQFLHALLMEPNPLAPSFPAENTMRDAVLIETKVSIVRSGLEYACETCYSVPHNGTRRTRQKIKASFAYRIADMGACVVFLH